MFMAIANTSRLTLLALTLICTWLDHTSKLRVFRMSASEIRKSCFFELELILIVPGIQGRSPNNSLRAKQVTFDLT
jgi:hypothetical protein